MLVVEDICQRMQGETALEVLPPQIVRLRKVQHLRRCIWAELDNPDDARCLHLLQPTAAVAGLPRQVALEFITRHDFYPRLVCRLSRLSVAGAKRASASLCVRRKSKTIRSDCTPGRGSSAGSDPEQEWQEIENKAAGLRSLLLTET